MRTFTANGAEASDSLVRSMIKNNDGWAHSVLSQCFGVPPTYREALLTGRAEWTVEDKNTLVINPQ